MNFISKSITLIALAGIILYASCGSSTSIVSSWKDPDVSPGSENLKKILAIVVTRNETSRRLAEDRAYRKDHRIFQSYKIFPAMESLSDEAKAQELIRNEGYDGIITFRLLDRTARQTFVPGMGMGMGGMGMAPMGGYWGFHRAHWGMGFHPGQMQTDINYIIECNVFSLKSDKLLWTGVTNTVNPSNIDRMSKEVLYYVRKQMIRDGFLEK